MGSNDAHFKILKEKTSFSVLLTNEEEDKEVTLKLKFSQLENLQLSKLHKDKTLDAKSDEKFEIYDFKWFQDVLTLTLKPGAKPIFISFE